MMVGEDLSVFRCKESSAKNINVHLWSNPRKAHQGVVGLVGSRLARAGERRILQVQPGIVIAEGDYYMDETDARLISVDNRMCNAALAFEFLKAAFNCRYLVLESGVVWLAACSFGRLVQETLVGTVHQALLREYAGLQARDGGIDSDIFRVVSTVERE
jgi:hypothetical protein